MGIFDWAVKGTFVGAALGTLAATGDGAAKGAVVGGPVGAISKCFSKSPCKNDN